MSAAPSLPRRAPARGFVLVGVVMMVMALTIIGISLYSLSGYESQFFGRSLFDRQALYSASGGLELAKALLSTPLGSPAEYRLSNVARAIGREGIVSAVAWQNNPSNSTGAIDWSDSVTVRIGVQVSGHTRTVQARFMGSTVRSPYDHLFTCPNVIVNINPQPGSNRPTILVGKIWQTIRSSADTAWTSSLDNDTRISFVQGDAPAPASAAFIGANLAGAVPANKWWPVPGRTYLDMDAGSEAGARYFTCASDESTTHHTAMSPYFDFYSQRAITVRVRGTAIWLIPRGTQIEGDFVVECLPGASSGTLVMVVGPNERYAYPAPFTQAGVDKRQYGPILDKGIKIATSNTSMFLVSHGTVRLHRPYIAGEEFVANGLSVFATNIEFEGPDYQEPRKDMRFEYPAWLQPIASSLVGRRLLPSWVGVSTGQWTLQAGSWTTSPGLQ